MCRRGSAVREIRQGLRTWLPGATEPYTLQWGDSESHPGSGLGLEGAGGGPSIRPSQSTGGHTCTAAAGSPRSAAEPAEHTAMRQAPACRRWTRHDCWLVLITLCDGRRRLEQNTPSPNEMRSYNTDPIELTGKQLTEKLAVLSQHCVPTVCDSITSCVIVNVIVISGGIYPVQS